MKENIKLIKQITQLRKKVKELTITVKKHDRNLLISHLTLYLYSQNQQG
jgi:hypothetical protein